MYIWVVLATFVTALFSYNLSVRPDARDLYLTPQAQVIVSKLLIQHEAASKVFKENYKKSKNNRSLIDENQSNLNAEESQDSQSGESGDEAGGTTGDSAQESSDAKMSFAYEIKSSNITDLQKYMPIEGFSPAAGEVSKAFCVKSKDLHDKRLFNKCAGNDNELSCCSGAEGNFINDEGIEENSQNNAKMYLVTTLPIPIRWQARGSDGQPLGIPNEDLIRAIKKSSAIGIKVGYLAPKSKYVAVSGKDDNGNDVYDAEQIIDKEFYKDSGGTPLKAGDFDYFISGFNDTLIPIPNAIGSKLINENCKVNNCLVMMSTIR